MSFFRSRKLAPVTSDFLLECKDLVRHYGKIKPVDGVSLNLRPHELLSILGPSGCGKSTTGKALLQLPHPTSGSVQLDGEELTQLSRTEMTARRTDIQMIFQDPYSSLNPRMLVKDIVQESLDINSTLTENEKIEKVHWLLDKVGLSAEQSNRYPHEFSGGQRQRIGIARALATEPEIVIADEPVSALDVSIQAQIINLMMDLQNEFDLSIIFIAHDLSVVKHISDRVGVMNLGELVEINETGQIFSDPQHDYTKELLRAIPEPDPFGREERKRKRLNI